MDLIDQVICGTHFRSFISLLAYNRYDNLGLIIKYEFGTGEIRSVTAAFSVAHSLANCIIKRCHTLMFFFFYTESNIRTLFSA